MILSGIAKRYAVALFNVAHKEDIAEQVNGDIDSFRKLFESNVGFKTFIGSPQVLTDAKKELIRSVFGERTSGLFVKFVMLLIDKKRMMHIDEIAHSYTQLYERHCGVVEVKAITAIGMDHDLQTHTRQSIEAKLGKTVRLTASVDERILGGMILIIEEKIIDGSIRYKLDSFKKSLSELKVN